MTGLLVTSAKPEINVKSYDDIVYTSNVNINKKLKFDENSNHSSSIGKEDQKH